jgi:acyl-coenzyme A thioesterase PaaI-like protein
MEGEDVGASMATALAKALKAETEAAAGAPTRLVSITCDLIAEPAASETRRAAARVTRATKTLVFVEAELYGEADRRLMRASGLYRVLG